MHGAIDIERIRTRARAMSKALLGSQFRAEIAAFVGVGTAPFWARGVSQQLGIPENKVAAELARFADEGLLVALPGDAWDRRKLYEPRRAGDGYWQAGYELIERAAAEEAARVGLEADAVVRTYMAAVHGPTPDTSLRGRR